MSACLRTRAACRCAPECDSVLNCFRLLLFSRVEFLHARRREDEVDRALASNDAIETTADFVAVVTKLKHRRGMSARPSWVIEAQMPACTARIDRARAAALKACVIMGPQESPWETAHKRLGHRYARHLFS